MNFQEKLDKITLKNNSLVCVGLDSDFDKLPQFLKTKDNPQFDFNKAIIDATHDLVCCYKPNSAFYEALGDKGITQLKMTCDYLKTTFPEISILLDAKRGDIGSTNKGYVKYAYDYLGADAVTLQPYLGRQALEPFLQIADKGCFILVRTSNPGAGELQDLLIDDIPLYKIVAEKIVKEWNNSGNVMLVAGATYPEELAEIRKIAGDTTILTPGIGAQEGTLEKTVRGGVNWQKAGLIINASRSIIYASSDEDFAQKARDETEKLRNQINTFRTIPPISESNSITQRDGNQSIASDMLKQITGQ